MSLSDPREFERRKREMDDARFAIRQLHALRTTQQEKDFMTDVKRQKRYYFFSRALPITACGYCVGAFIRLSNGLSLVGGAFFGLIFGAFHAQKKIKLYTLKKLHEGNLPADSNLRKYLIYSIHHEKLPEEFAEILEELKANSLATADSKVPLYDSATR